MSLNVKLLRKVKKHILAEPARLRMSSWITHGEAGKFKQLPRGSGGTWGEKDHFVLPACGTVGCIAGWTCRLGGREGEEGWGVEKAAAELLNIDKHHKLFMVDSWKPKFRTRYIRAKRQQTRANIVGEVIEDFIKTGE